MEPEPELLGGADAAISDSLAAASSPPPAQERLGGARAGFVATLGRRVAELRGLVKLLSADPGAARHRDDLRRRLHALSAGSRLLRFSKLAEELTASEALLGHAAERGSVTPAELGEIRAVLDRVPALAWGQASVGETPPPPARVAAPRSVGRARTVAALDAVRVPLGPAEGAEPSPRGPLTVLVIGPATIADALTASEPADAKEADFEVERRADCDGALDLARVVAPDVVVLDAERPGALALCEALSSDLLTELTPILVLGRFLSADAAAPFVAAGVARALPKPVSPDVLRRACAEAAATHVRRDIRRAPLGELTVDELGARLAEELRRGLGDAAVASGRGTRVNLGEGSEVLAALWGAVARIRDLVTIQSTGEVRFAPSGPEGAMPLAPWLGSDDDAGVRSRLESSRHGAAMADLNRKVIVVADDDPAVTWFLSGVFQAAGAIVHEAHDGARALQIAFRFTPDLVVSDILMPGLDGFALCRALKRDLVLRDVPVILLSWKEDLLQRVRELGADADGYLRKEASAAAVVQRVREVLGSRQRIAERIAGATPQAEVRGRLDGITTRTLLGLACAHRPSSTVTVRDAAFLYEVEIREGRPVRATRTAPDGLFERGASVLGELLSVGAGRFVVAPAPDHPFPEELHGSLDEQLLPRIALARAAQRLLSGVALIGVERVDLSEDRIRVYASATPEPARSLLRTLAAGVSPRALITSGQAAPRLVEDVLCDAAAHGAVTAVIGPEGDELLDEAIEQEIAILQGELPPRPPVVIPALDLGPAAPSHAHASSAISSSATSSSETDSSASAAPLPENKVAPETPRSPTVTAFPITLAIPQVPSATPAAEHDTPSPGTLAEPVFIPPVAPVAPVVAPVAPVVAPVALTPTPAPIRASSDEKPLLTLLSQTPPLAMHVPAPRKVPNGKAPSGKAPGGKAPGGKTPAPLAIHMLEESPTLPVRRPSAFAPATTTIQDKPRKAAAKSSHTLWALFAVTGVVFAVGARLSRSHHGDAQAAPLPSDPVEATTAATSTAAGVAAMDEPARYKVDGESKVAPILPVETALREEDKVPPGQGMLEVVAGLSDTIYIDGTPVGNGPVVKRALAPKKEPYEVRVKLRGEERVRFVVVKEARLTRLRVAPPWSR